MKENNAMFAATNLYASSTDYRNSTSRAANVISESTDNFWMSEKNEK